MNPPKNYEWLANVGQLPKTIFEGLKLFGVQEVVGKGSSATILGWRDELNQAGVKISGYSDDSIAWCGLYAAIVAHRAGKDVVKEPLWARNWAKFGVKAAKPSLGDILVFERGEGGHVALYVGEDATTYHILGGNQKDQVSITRWAKSRLLAARRPKYTNQPASVKPYIVKATGVISKDAA